MTAWTVVLSSQFRATIANTTSEFTQRLQKATSTNVEAELKQWREFRSFTSTVLDLEERKLDPTRVLKHYKADKAGTNTYVLLSASGRWCGSFSADKSKKVYYGIEVHEKPQ